MKNKVLSLISISLALIAICWFAVIPLLHAGYFTMHDDEQIGRLQQMFLVLSQGQIPPRWIPDLGFGFGYPLFNFYPPFVYYIGSLFHLVGFSFIDATKVVMGLGFILSAAAMFVWVRKHFGIISGFFAAILYTYAPYHSVDLYVRGALSEFFSWIFVPLIFWATDMLAEKHTIKSVIVLGIAFSLLMLTHSLVMLQIAPLFIVYAGILLLFKKEKRAQLLLQIILAGIIGLGLSAYFWLPSIMEKQVTLVDTILTRELASYAIHFVCPIQLWSGPWGYGGSAAGCVDGLSFQVGKIQLIVGILGVLLSIFFMFKNKKLSQLNVGVIFLCSIFLVLPYSKFLWDIAKPFWYIQFPWRYLLFVAVGSAFLGGYILYLLKRRFGMYAALGIAIILSSLAMYQVRNYFKPQAYRAVTDATMTSQIELQWRVSRMSYEYVPKDVPTKLSPENTTELAITYADVPVVSSFGTGGDSRVSVKELENKADLKKYVVNVYNTKTQSPPEMQINVFIFPGWAVYIDGKKQKIFSAGYGVIGLLLPNGRHTVLAKFENTPIRVIANTISVVTAISLIGIFLWKIKK